MFYIMGLHRLEQAVLKKWKSTAKLHAFLYSEFERINQSCFGGTLESPQLRVRRIWLPKHLFASGQMVAHYQPLKNSIPATISLFPHVLMNKADVRTALVHEMIHHWESTAKDPAAISYPVRIDARIARRFSDDQKERGWRSRHSEAFLGKACTVAATLGVPVDELLFKE